MAEDALKRKESEFMGRRAVEAWRKRAEKWMKKHPEKVTQLEEKQKSKT